MKSLEQSEAPWTPEQSSALSRFQRGATMVPIECADPDFDSHKSKGRTMTAVQDGLVCPSCGAQRVSVSRNLLAYAIAQREPIAEPVVKKRKGRA